MLKRYQDTLGDIFRAVDACIVVLAWLAAWWGRYYLSPVIHPDQELADFHIYAKVSPLIAILWMAVFSWMHVYYSKRMLSAFDEIVSILRAHGVAMLSFIAIAYLFKDVKYSRFIMMYFAVLSALGICTFRLALRGSLRQLRARGYNLRHTLAVGEGPAIESVMQRLQSFPELGIRIVGMLTSRDSTVQSKPGIPVLGHYEQIIEVIRSTKVDQVVISLPPEHYQELDRLIDALRDETIDVRFVPDVHRYITLGCDVENFHGFPVVRLNDSPMVGWGAYAKRATDVLGSALALLILSPVLLVIGALVKLTSRGPMLYAQERMGLDGRTFHMLKFRSMKQDAEQKSGAVWAQQVDDRRTAFGTFLRKTSLDELPQFWNVLCGDMSLVGPRPERPVFVNKFRSEIPMYMLRHKVKAGITGWAQINGWRGNTSLARRIECDIFYIRNWSYALDLKILLFTVWKGFINKNAY